MDVSTGKKNANAGQEIVLSIDAEKRINPQGYRLSISPDGISIQAVDKPGLFYGVNTLTQLFSYYAYRHSQFDEPFQLPSVEITDWPDFPNRGVMLDISRDKVPSMETLYTLVDMLASWKINQIQLYTEHTFAYRQHQTVWAEASPMTGDEILSLDTFCMDRCIELVPNQNSFGHMERWLKHPQYRSLAEAADGFDFPWGHHEGPFSLCPTDPGSISLLRSLYDELLPHFSSRQFNVGCDETFDVGQGRSRQQCELYGTGQVYLDFVLQIYREVGRRGHQMQFWADIILSHPELVAQIPDDCIALEWGYEGHHPFDKHCEKLAQAGLAFYVCPGTSAWNSISGRTDNCLQNLSSAAANGLKHGAKGYLITDWGDNGHWQMLPVSYLGFAAGAAFSWCFASNRNMDISECLDRYAFRDASNILGAAAYQLGNIYRHTGVELENTTLLFEILQRDIRRWASPMQNYDLEAKLEQVNCELQDVHPEHSRPSRDDAQMLQREFNLTLAMLKHACQRGMLALHPGQGSQISLTNDLLAIRKEFEAVWLSRNRPGGLKDSLVHFDTPLRDYQIRQEETSP